MNKELTKDERSLLLFLETIAVDHWGIVDDMRNLNADDIKIMKKWNEESFVIIKRISRKHPRMKGTQLTYAIRLLGDAWELAHQLRKERALRHIPDEVSNVFKL